MNGILLCHIFYVYAGKGNDDSAFDVQSRQNLFQDQVKDPTFEIALLLVGG